MRCRFLRVRSKVKKFDGRKLLLVLVIIVASLFGLRALWDFSVYDAVKINFERTQVTSLDRMAVSDYVAANKFISAEFSQDPEFYLFNKNLSDRIGAFRPLPDTRVEECSSRFYYIPNAKRSKVSVIIAFYNEARSALLRTIMSVKRRSPAIYLHEIILIDDHSDDVGLLDSLSRLDISAFNDFSANRSNPYPVIIKMQRNPRRRGVIESRNRGARLATGDYLLFLDSHCEVNVGWLEPLLERVAGPSSSSSFTAVSPVLDIIDPATLEYRASSRHSLGGFDWNLHFHWATPEMQRHRSDNTEAYKSPTFAGGIFMISRNWFFKLKGFNPQLKIWGGESIEFSIKLWLCGGQIEIVPCSRIGHIFRSKHPFDFPPYGDDGLATYLRNSKIIAESWLDGYKYFFYASKPSARDIPLDIPYEALRTLKRDLNCRPFAWYLQHVYQRLKPPHDDFIAFGSLSSAGRCLRIEQGSEVRMASCYDAGITHWYLNRRSSRLHTENGACLDVVASPDNSVTSSNHSSHHLSASYRHRYRTEYIVVLRYCRSSMDTQQWIRHRTQLVHAETHLCLDNQRGDVVMVNQCRHEAPSQLFRFSIEVQAF